MDRQSGTTDPDLYLFGARHQRCGDVGFRPPIMLERIACAVRDPESIKQTAFVEETGRRIAPVPTCPCGEA